MLKKLKLVLAFLIVVPMLCVNAFAEDDFYFDEEDTIEVGNVNTEEQVDNQDSLADTVSVNALNDYKVEGSLFEKITLLEQDKVVLQLEKERAQLDLELERLNAEKMKLQMELDTLSGRAEQQQQELEVAKAQLEAQAEQIKKQRENLDNQEKKTVNESIVKSQKQDSGSLRGRYKLINIAGVGNQLQATVEEISSGQNKKLSVGKELDGYIIKSISLNEGIVFEKNGVSENLNIGK